MYILSSVEIVGISDVSEELSPLFFRAKQKKKEKGRNK
jgi:hypothetical protein